MGPRERFPPSARGADVGTHLHYTCGLDVRNIFVNAADYVRSEGLRGYAQSASATLVERWYERRLGVETSRFDTMRDLGIDDPDAVDHAPVPYVALRSALARVRKVWLTWPLPPQRQSPSAAQPRRPTVPKRRRTPTPGPRAKRTSTPRPARS